MDDYLKTAVKISLDVDEASRQRADDIINELGKKIDLPTINFDELRSDLEDSLRESIQDAFEVDTIDDALSSIADLRGEEVNKLREELELLKAQKSGNDEQIDALEAQKQLLEEKSEIERELNELSRLGTKEAKEKTKELQSQLKALNRQIPGQKESKAANAIDYLNNDIAAFSIFGNEFTKGASKFSRVLTGISGGFLSGLKSIGDVFIESVADIINEGKKAADELMGAGFLSDSSTRQTVFDWGTNLQGAYGIDQAMRIMGFNSQEDVWHATNDQQSRFYELQNKYANKFIEMQESGLFEDLLENQIAMNELEYDMQVEEALFYKENIEYIKEIRTATLTIKTFFVKTLGSIVKLFDVNANDHFTSNKSAVSDYLSSQATRSVTTNTTSMSIDNSFNNQSVDTKSALENIINQFYNVLVASAN